MASRSFHVLMLLTLAAAPAQGELPVPTLETVFPSGAAAGSAVSVELSGRSLTGLKSIQSSIPGFRCDVQDATHGQISIPAGTPPGSYELWACCEHGVTSPRSFVVSHRHEELESADNNALKTATPVSLNTVLNGRIEQPGDIDVFRFEAKAGQRIILDCSAERIDSRLRAILEVFDAQGQRLAVNRGYYGIDPLIGFRAPATGSYFVKVHDLVFSGGGEHYYRLEFDAGPRVAFTVPSVIPRDQTSRVRLHGWNLTDQRESGIATENASPVSDRKAEEYDSVEVEIPAANAQEMWPLPVRLGSHQLAARGFPYHLPGSNSSVFIGVSDDPVIIDRDDNHTPASALPLTVPCDVSGRLVAGDERDWFAFDAKRGEVLHLEIMSQRQGYPTDLQLSLWNSTGDQILAEWNDEVKSVGGLTFTTSHLDPAGRFVAPADGRYLFMVRNVTGGLRADPRRSYQLTVRREEPDLRLVAIPKGTAPTGFNLRKGGRFAFDVLALRQRGMKEPIRISAADLPAGVECPDIVLGPGVDQATMVVSAGPSVDNQFLSLNLTGHAESVGTRPVRGGAVIRAGQPQGWSRLTAGIPLAVIGDAPVLLTATIHDQVDHLLYGKLKLRSSPGSVIDIAVTMEQRQPGHQPAVKLSGVGLPPGIAQQTSTVPAGTRTGMISFYLPTTLAPGDYSWAIAGETTVPTTDGKTEVVTAVSNSLTIAVEPAAFQVEIDPFTVQRVKRGETFQVKYATPRINGFIGKIHTELASPGVVTNVPGLRGRGVTFTGQSDQASIQVLVNEDAPLGRQPFVRLFAVGVIEDQPTFFGAALFPLEIVE